jgi:hypothetical protein
MTKCAKCFLRNDKEEEEEKREREREKGGQELGEQTTK